MVNILEEIQKMQELQKQSETLNRLVMHPSAAERILEFFLGMECVINPICPKENIFMMNRKDPYMIDRNSPED